MTCHFSGGMGRGVFLRSLPILLSPRHADCTACPSGDWLRKNCAWEKAMLGHTGCIYYLMMGFSGPGKKMANLLSVEYLCGFFWIQTPQCRPWFSFGQPFCVQSMIHLLTIGDLIISSRWSSCPRPEMALGSSLSGPTVGPWETLIHTVSHREQGVHSFPTCNRLSHPTTKGSHQPFS